VGLGIASFIEAGRDLLTLRSRGLGLVQGGVRLNAAGGIYLFIVTLSTLRAGLGGLDGGEKHERQRREKEKEDILLEGESSANRGCLQVST
jgi:hypothetical protein